MSIEEQVRMILSRRFNIYYSGWVDESALHRGHTGFPTGAGHYRLTLVSDDFINLSRLERHRAVYDVLLDLLPTKIHALTLELLTVAQWHEYDEKMREIKAK